MVRLLSSLVLSLLEYQQAEQVCWGLFLCMANYTSQEVNVLGALKVVIRGAVSTILGEHEVFQNPSVTSSALLHFRFYDGVSVRAVLW